LRGKMCDRKKKQEKGLQERAPIRRQYRNTIVPLADKNGETVLTLIITKVFSEGKNQDRLD